MLVSCSQTLFLDAPQRHAKKGLVHTPFASGRSFSKTGWVLISDDLLKGWAVSLSQPWQILI